MPLITYIFFCTYRTYSHINLHIVFLQFYILFQVLYKIISDFTIVVNNDADKGWTTIFDKIKELTNGVKEPTQGTLKFVNDIKHLNETGTLAVQNIDDLAHSILGVDKSVVSTAKDVQKGTKTIADLENSVNSASSSNAKFATSLKNIAANMGIMLAINLAIKAAVAIWDAVNVTVAEVDEKIAGLTSSLNELNREYEELSSRDTDSLSQSEKDRLQYLDDRIEREERLLEIEQARKYSEEFGRGFTDYFDDDNYNAQYSKSMIASSWEDFIFDLFDSSFLLDYFKGSKADNFDILSINAKNLVDEYKDIKKLYDEAETELENIEKGLIKEDNIEMPLDEYKNLIEADKTAFDEKLEAKRKDMEDYISAYESFLLSDKAAVEEAEKAIADPSTTSNDKENAEETKKIFEERIKITEHYIEELKKIAKTSQTELESLDERLDNISSDKLKENFTDEEIHLLSEQSIDSDATIDDLKKIISPVLDYYRREDGKRLAFRNGRLPIN